MSSKKEGKEETAYGYSSETDHLVEFSESRPKQSKGVFLCYGSIILLLLLVACTAIGVGVGLGIKFGTSSTTFPSRMTSSNLMGHLQELQTIADKDPEQFSRAVQFGYNASAEFVINKLESAGFEDVSKQYFRIATYDDNGGSTLSAIFTTNSTTYEFDFIRGTHFSVLRYSNSTGGVPIEGNLSFVQGPCSADNYTAESIAIIDYILDEEEAGCSLLDMVMAADEAEVKAVIMMRRENDTTTSLPNARIYSQDFDEETFEVSPLPVMGASNLLGKQLEDYVDLSDSGTVVISLSTDTIINFWETYNVLAYTSDHEKDDAIIVVGSHLDSVAAGPGINDNGSGSAANLEMAIQLITNSIKPVNKVLFAFWGAEELGLLGSTHFVAKLTETERENIALNLNFDMIGSPNYVRQIYEGSNAENEKIIKGSEKIEKLFAEFFVSKNLNFSYTDFNGRSDYGPFIAEGIDIPAGGLATGAETPKTEEQRISFGGFANASLDPCYHRACDTVYNINEEAYLQMSQAAAYVLNELMMKEDLKEYLDS